MSGTADSGVRIDAPIKERYAEILTDEALAFLAGLHRAFDARRRELLELRAQRYAELAAGGTFDFLTETRAIREDDSWTVAPHAPGLVDRRAEITGPTDRKMTINAMNSGAKVWLADLEDANTPLWENLVEGQLNLRDAIDRAIDFSSPEGKSYALADEVATIVVRPRGWHLPEKHILVDGERTSGSLTDFGLYFFHCAQKQLD
ncbi:MAG: malate synthase A, partial [Sporichthyaceae bacterium]